MLQPHSEYVIIVIAIPLKQWLQKRPAMLRYTYIACHVLYFFVRKPGWRLQTGDCRTLTNLYLTAIRHIFPYHFVSIACALDSLSLNNLGLLTISAIDPPHDLPII